jgi:hypothetical protein
MECALEQGADLICSLDNSTASVPNLLYEVGTAIETNERVAVVGPKVCYIASKT